ARLVTKPNWLFISGWRWKGGLLGFFRARVAWQSAAPRGSFFTFDRERVPATARFSSYRVLIVLLGVCSTLWNNTFLFGIGTDAIHPTDMIGQQPWPPLICPAFRIAV